MTGKKRVLVEVDMEEHRKLKAKLAKDGTTIAAWLRKLIQKFLGSA